MPRQRDQHVVDSELRLSDEGVRDADNAAIRGVAVITIRRWKRDYRDLGKARGQPNTPCPRCDGAPLDTAAYAELLGWYLGDGHISQSPRGVLSLHIFNDSNYTKDNERIKELMVLVKPGGRPTAAG